MGTGGSIILTGSSAGTTGAPAFTAYSAEQGGSAHALAKAFARKGIEVSVATTRDPASFAADAAATGPKVHPKTLAEAVKVDIIFLAVRFEAHPDVANALPTWKGKIIIDVTNAFGVPPDDLGGQPSSKFVAQAFSGAKLVKGFNHLVAAVLDQDPAVHGGKKFVFLASDDDGAADQIGALAEKLGFAPIKLGGLSEGGLLFIGITDLDIVLAGSARAGMAGETAVEEFGEVLALAAAA